MATMTCIVAVYYTVIMAWTLFYFVMSFSASLPWSHCDNPWNTDACYMRLSKQDPNITGTSWNYSNQSERRILNITTNTSADIVLKTPTEEFWE